MRAIVTLCFTILIVAAASGCGGGSQSTGPAVQAHAEPPGRDSPRASTTPPNQLASTDVHHVFKPALADGKESQPTSVVSPSPSGEPPATKPEYELLSQAVNDLRRMLADKKRPRTK